MARQKTKICLSCQRVFRGRADARTCSERCRKRLQRAKAAVETEVEHIEHSTGEAVKGLEAKLTSHATEEGFATGVAAPATTLPANPLPTLQPAPPSVYSPPVSESLDGSTQPTAPSTAPMPLVTPAAQADLSVPAEPAHQPGVVLAPAVTSNNTPVSLSTNTVLPATPATNLTAGPLIPPVEPQVETPKQPRFQRHLFRLPAGAKFALTGAFVVVVVAIGMYLLGNQFGLNQAKSNPNGGTPTVTTKSGLSESPSVTTLEINRTTVIAGGNSFTTTGPVLFKNQTNSTSAFSVQDANASGVLTVDTTNLIVGIDTTPTAGGASLQVGGSVNISGQYLVNGQPLGSSSLADFSNITRMGNSFNGPNELVELNISGILPALNGSLLTNVDAITLQGNGASYYTNASNISSGTLGDSRLSTNVALLNANNTFTGNNILNGNNTFNGQNIFNGVTIQNGNFLFQSATNATNAFQIQNAAGNDNLLVADTINTRVGIGVQPNYTLDVNGDINVSAGNTFRIGGASICNASGCTPSSSSGSFIQNSTALQTNANFNFQSADVNGVGGIIRGASGQMADLFEGQTSTGSQVFALDPSGNVNIIGQYEINGAPICTVGGCTVASGSGSYIQNGTALQATANFNIESAAIGNVVGILKGISGQTADLLQAKNGNGAVVLTVGNQGQTLHKDTSSGSHTFFQVQDSSSQSLLTADTITGQVLFPNADLSSTALLLGGDANLYRSTNSTLKTDGNLIAAGNLTVNGTGLFKNTTDSTTALQVQNAAGTSNLLVADTSHTAIGVAMVPLANVASLQVTGGIDLATTNTVNSNTNSLVGIYNDVTNNGAGNAGMQGFYADLNNNSTGTLAWARDYEAKIRNNSTGTITDAYDFYARTPSNTGGGTIVSAYGIYLQGSSTTGVTNPYGVYQAGANDLNFFNGKVGIGNNNPQTSLQVSGTTGIRLAGTGTNTDTIDLVPGVASTYDRLDFKAVTTNRGVAFQLSPNGTSTSSKLALANAADNLNFGSLFVDVEGTQANISPQVSGTGTAVTALNFGAGAGTSNWSNILFSSGNVGIGTSSNPGSLLSVGGTTGNLTVDSSGTIRDTGFIQITRSTGGAAFQTLLPGDSSTRLRIVVDGALQWADGINPQDTNLYRASAGVLKTDNSFTVGTNLAVTGTSTLTGSLAANGSATFADSTNSTTAFQIQNNAGTSILTADTTNQLVTVANLQSTGTITLQNGQGAGIQLRTVSNSSPGNAMTFSGNEITDVSRSVHTQGDGRQPPDSSTGIWETTTNLMPNGGAETNSNGFVNNQHLTVSRATTVSKFGVAAFQGTSTTTGVWSAEWRQTDGNTNISASAGSAYTFSLWSEAASNYGTRPATINIIWCSTTPCSGGNIISTSTANISNSSTSWTRYSVTATAPASTTIVRLSFNSDGSPGTGETNYFDGVQFEQKAYATPYVETSAGVATRNPGSITAPASLINSSQSWVAARIRLGFASTAPVNNNTNAAVFSLDDGTNNERIQLVWNAPGAQWQVRRCHTNACDTTPVSADTFSAGDLRTVIMKWDASNNYVSVGGANFTSIAISQTPGALTSLYIGSSGTGNTLDGDILWEAMGTGTLSNADAATLFNYGNSDPTLSNLQALNSGASSASFRWDGESTQYSGTNNSFTNDSQISIDDVNLTHTANGSLSLQGGVNSTTAFQVQNAAGTNELVVDTTNGKVAVGPSGVPANGALTIGTNTTANSGGIYFGTDTNLYRSGTGQLQTDSAFIIQPTTNPATALSVTGTYSTSGSFENAIVINPTYTPTTSVNTRRGLSSAPTFNPGSGVTISNVAGINSQVATGSGAGSITGLIGISAATPTYGSIKPTTSTGVSIGNYGASGITTAIGLDVTTYTGATTDIGVRIAKADTYTLQLSDTSGTAASGIEFGTDTNLYRLTNNTLRTDGAFISNGQLFTNSTLAVQQGTGNYVLVGNAAVALGQNSDITLSRTGVGALKVQGTSNSTTAFQIQNSGGTSILTADTNNQLVTVANLQSTGTITLQNGQGAGIQLRTVSNSASGGAMTFSGNEITDASRSVHTQGDGRQPPDSSTGIWESTTNIVPNGGFESNTTSWTAGSGSGSSASIARVTTSSKFGLDAGELTATNNGNFAYGAVDVSGAIPFNTGVKYTASFWAKSNGGTVSNWQFIIEQSNGTNVVMNSQSFIVTNSWQRFTFTFTPATTGVSTVMFFTPNVNNQTGVLDLDGVQLEQKGFATPYVETSAGVATRNPGSITAPASLINSSQSWVAARIRLGFASTAPVNNNTNAAVFSLDDGTNNERIQLVWNAPGAQWQVRRCHTNACDTTPVSADTFSAGDLRTVIMKWDASNNYVSVGGANFASAAIAHTPGALTSLYIGSSSTGSPLDGDILWEAMGTGTLSNADATSINNFGNSDPTLAGLNAIDSADASTFAWDGESIQYSGANNSFTNNSQLSLDDVNLTHAGNGSLTLQGAVNSTAAFQVQNASGTAIFNVDTTSGIVGTAITNAASTNSQGFTLQTGNALGATSNSGSLIMDTGTATGTAGSISIGTANSPTINIGSVGSTSKNTTIHIADSSAGVQSITIGSTNSTSAVNIQAGTGRITLTGQIKVAQSGTALSNSNLAESGAGSPTLGAGSTDTAGSFTTSTTSHTTITLTFGATMTNAPYCVVTSGNAAAAAIAGSSTSYYVTTTATTLVVNTAADTTAAQWNYFCVTH